MLAWIYSIQVINASYPDYGTSFSVDVIRDGIMEFFSGCGSWHGQGICVAASGISHRHAECKSVYCFALYISLYILISFSYSISFFSLRLAPPPRQTPLAKSTTESG